MSLVFKNNASTTLSGSIGTGDTTITVTSGAVFPAITARVSIGTATNGTEGVEPTQKLLIHSDVANAATVFTDVSGKTPVNQSTYFSGNTSTFKFGTASARNTTSGSAGCIYDSSTDFSVGTGDFHASCWVNWDVSTQNPIITLEASASVYVSVAPIVSSGTYIYASNGSGSTSTSAGSSYSTGTWYYLALERYNGLFYVYRDTSRVINAWDATTYNPNLTGTTLCSFGNSSNNVLGSNTIRGYLDEMTFFSKSLYQGAASITVPTGPWTWYNTPVQSATTSGINADDYFYATITEGSDLEIVKVTNISSNTLTVVRGQDGTSGTAFTSAATIGVRLPNIAMTDYRSELIAKALAV